MEQRHKNDLKFWLSISKTMEFKPQTFYRLLLEFKSAKKIWMAQEKDLRQYLSANKVDSFIAKKKSIDPESLEKILARLNITPITINNKEYPRLLKEIADPPPVLFVKGNIAILNSNCFAVVGSRKATNIGKDITLSLAKRISEKHIVIVSGLAEGIDSQAHLGSLAGCGKTIAVLGNSLDHIYPASNIDLARKIIDNGGALVCEYFPYTKTEKYFFVARNRIISGMSKGVLVTEAAAKSGALITADFALDQNRNVYSIPGDITKNQSLGTNNLLKQGAKIVTSIKDILEDFGLEDVGEVHADISKLEKIILESITEPKTIDEISASLRIDHSEVLESISLLELKGLVKNCSGQIYKK